MEFILADFLQHNRSKIIDEWVGKIQTGISERYTVRPREEILGTVTEAFDAYVHLLVSTDFSYINRFIEKITQMRLETGFPLSDVQRAFEYFGSVVLSLLEKEPEIATVETFCANSFQINRCVMYTIHRFSDHFQAMHEKKQRLSAIGEAVAHVSHEIKNPLMLIGGFSNQILSSLGDQDEKIGKKLRTIIEEVKRLEDFLKDIGRFAKDVAPCKRTIQLDQILQRIMALFESEFDVRGIRVSLLLSTDCSQIAADPDQLEQVLLNLIKNAIEAMPEGGNLFIKSYSKDGKVFIEIADSGIGITEEDMVKIGTPFFTTRNQGTGLGLSICQKIMKAHHGSLTISSEGQGNGAVATIQFPIETVSGDSMNKS